MHHRAAQLLVGGDLAGGGPARKALAQPRTMIT
jgi:hypothetical protein